MEAFCRITEKNPSMPATYIAERVNIPFDLIDRNCLCICYIPITFTRITIGCGTWETCSSRIDPTQSRKCDRSKCDRVSSIDAAYKPVGSLLQCSLFLNSAYICPEVLPKFSLRFLKCTFIVSLGLCSRFPIIGVAGYFCSVFNPSRCLS